MGKRASMPDSGDNHETKQYGRPRGGCLGRSGRHAGGLTIRHCFRCGHLCAVWQSARGGRRAGGHSRRHGAGFLCRRLGRHRPADFRPLRASGGGAVGLCRTVGVRGRGCRSGRGDADAGGCAGRRGADRTGGFGHRQADSLHSLPGGERLSERRGHHHHPEPVAASAGHRGACLAVAGLAGTGELALAKPCGRPVRDADHAAGPQADQGRAGGHRGAGGGGGGVLSCRLAGPVPTVPGRQPFCGGAAAAGRAKPVDGGAGAVSRCAAGRVCAVGRSGVAGVDAGHPAVHRYAQDLRGAGCADLFPSSVQSRTGGAGRRQYGLGLVRRHSRRGTDGRFHGEPQQRGENPSLGRVRRSVRLAGVCSVCAAGGLGAHRRPGRHPAGGGLSHDRPAQPVFHPQQIHAF